MLLSLWQQVNLFSAEFLFSNVQFYLFFCDVVWTEWTQRITDMVNISNRLDSMHKRVSKAVGFNGNEIFINL
jgi:hypothetical protein